MTSPLSRAEQVREALTPGERAKTVASYLARANQRGVSETYLPEGAIILLREEATLVRSEVVGYRSTPERHQAALALLSAGQPEQEDRRPGQAREALRRAFACLCPVCSEEMIVGSPGEHICVAGCGFPWGQEQAVEVGTESA